MGLTADDFGGDEVLEVWPDNYDAVLVFDSVGTQWRVGPGGPVGLDYNVLPLVLEMSGVENVRWPDLFRQIRLMESEALRTMRDD